ncbi:hypothetical protein Q5741_05435 [Paenibacillus sp. JX-17]|uniref:Uncharacterized protein n=1 Tax=Paenibacillus lacisoli TaxID=3064525 RepID=A0ABT9CBD3_9BACL|nr:hypothetical protein [Paenibacillus sp. JX-17]MDO7905858.1 hypothetical protein [Paenibacillus sp. JX-17]
MKIEDLMVLQEYGISLNSKDGETLNSTDLNIHRHVLDAYIEALHVLEQYQQQFDQLSKLYGFDFKIPV